MKVKKIVYLLVLFVVLHSEVISMETQAPTMTPRYGVEVGTSFSWESEFQNPEIKLVSGLSNERIRQIMVLAETIQYSQMSPTFGNSAGNKYSWTVPGGQRIKQITCTSSQTLTSVSFVTNAGTASPVFGGNSGEPHPTFIIPDDYQITGIYGTVSDHITSLGFFLGKVPQKKKTSKFGNQNGPGYNWVPDISYGEIRKVYGKNGFYIDRMIVDVSDGQNIITSPSFGGNGGKAYSWDVPEGEYIKKVIFRRGKFLDSVLFVTDKGTQSPKIGGDGGQIEQTYIVPEGYRIFGIHGTKITYLLSLGFYITQAREFITTSKYGNPLLLPSFRWESGLKYGEVRKIYGRQGFFIDQIKVDVSTGFETDTSPAFGGNGGSSYEWMVPQEQYISQLIFKSGNHLDSVVFVTNKGRQSPKLGGEGGTITETYNIPEGYRLVGLHGTQKKYLFSLGFLVAKKKAIYTPIYGDFNAASKFEWEYIDSETDTANVMGRQGLFIDKFQLSLQNGETSPGYGGGGGKPFDFQVPAGESIRRVILRVGDHLDSARFITNRRTEYRAGSDGGNTNYIIDFPIGYNLVGFRGSKSRWIRSLGFILK